MAGNRSRSKQLLVDLLKAGGLISVALVAPGALSALQPFIRDGKFNRSDFNRTVKRLYKNNLISIQESGDQLTLKLEKKGREKAIAYSLDDIQLKEPKKWDGKWRIIIFDIPESRKLARVVLQRKLKMLNFQQLQKSVYVHPYPCEDEIEFIRSVYEVRQYVTVMLAEKIENDGHLRAYFEL